MLDFQQIQATGLWCPDTRRSRIRKSIGMSTSSARQCRRQGAAATEHANLIVVTSTHPGEEKPSRPAIWPLSIATERTHGLLVDADAKARRRRHWDSRLSWLVDFLIDDQMDLADVLVDTNVPSLTVLPAGSQHHLSTEPLAGEKHAAVGDGDESKRYPDRVVIFDSPPLLATTEASVLARLMGQVVVVVEAGRTQQSQVKGCFGPA